MYILRCKKRKIPLKYSKKLILPTTIDPILNSSLCMIKISVKKRPYDCTSTEGSPVLFFQENQHQEKYIVTLEYVLRR